MWTLGTDWYEILARVTVVYVAVILGVRFVGRRSLGQRTAVDFVLILIVANAVQNAMIGADTSLLGGLIAVMWLFLLDRVLGRFLAGHERPRRWLEGSPVVLINHGQVIESNLRRERVGLDELQAVLEEHGIDQVGQVKLAVLETDGSISIVPSSSETHRTSRKVRRDRPDRPVVARRGRA